MSLYVLCDVSSMYRYRKLAEKKCLEKVEFHLSLCFYCTVLLLKYSKTMFLNVFQVN